MTLEHKKINIIQQIAASSQEEFINAIDEFLRNFQRPKYTLDLSNHPNIEDKVDIEKIKRERPLVEFDMTEFEKEADSLEWDKSIEELLSELD